MPQNPPYCPDNTCIALAYMETLGGGKCIGKLNTPKSHIIKNINFLSRCYYDKKANKTTSSEINKDDFVVDIYLIGEALKALGLKIPASIAQNLPVK